MVTAICIFAAIAHVYPLQSLAMLLLAVGSVVGVIALMLLAALMCLAFVALTAVSIDLAERKIRPRPRRTSLSDSRIAGLGPIASDPDVDCTRLPFCRPDWVGLGEMCPLLKSLFAAVWSALL